MGYTLTIRDEFDVRLLDKVPGFLTLRMASLGGLTGETEKEIGVINQANLDFIRYVVEPEDRDKFERYLMEATPTIEFEELMEILKQAAQVYSGNSPGEEPSPSSPGSTEQTLPMAATAPTQDATEPSSTESSSVPVPTVSKTYCLLYTSPSPRDRQKSRMPSSA